MTLSESLYEIAKNNTYIDSKWLNAYARHISKLEARVAELEAQIPQWISVEDRLPEYQQPVIVYINNSQPLLMYRIKDDNGNDWYTQPLINGISAYDESYITHWMPLPKAPEEE